MVSFAKDGISMGEWNVFVDVFVFVRRFSKRFNMYHRMFSKGVTRCNYLQIRA